MDYLLIALYLVSGLMLGSFIGALTYRLPRNKGFVKGRSKCPHCKKTIAWYDNVPLVSYLILKGKCRKCGKKISARYFVIELTTALSFVGIYLLQTYCVIGKVMITACSWPFSLGNFSYIFLPTVFVIAFSIFVVDLEQQIIPDGLIFAGLVLSFFAILFSSSSIFENLFAAFLVSTFLLLIHLFTKGRGMGLGDVKFVLFPALLFGLKLSFVFVFVAFLTGAIVGLILILINKAKFGQKIAFGPFLVFAFFVTFLWGDKLFNFFIR